MKRPHASAIASPVATARPRHRRGSAELTGRATGKAASEPPAMHELKGFEIDAHRSGMSSEPVDKRFARHTKGFS
jgi:hypothetical protein